MFFILFQVGRQLTSFETLDKMLEEAMRRIFEVINADRGVMLAPGPSFGPYPTHVRLCFTAAPPEQVERGVSILAELMGR